MTWTAKTIQILLWTLSSTMILAQNQTQPATQPITTIPIPTSLERIQAALSDVSVPVAVTAPPAATTVATPANFAGAGVLYNPSGSPRVTGWATFAKLLDAKSETYLFTTEDAFVASGTKPFTITTSVRAGFATKLKEIGRVKVFGIVDGGGATAGSASGAAASGGGIATIRAKGNMYIMLGYRALMLQGQSGTPKLYEGGLGWAW